MFYLPAKGKEERKQAGGKGDEDEKDQTAVHREMVPLSRTKF